MLQLRKFSYLCKGEQIGKNENYIENHYDRE